MSVNIPDTKIREAFKVFQIASAKAYQESIESLFYTAICLTLGWVLDEPRYREELEEHIKRLKSMGVEPNKSVIEFPDKLN